MESLPTLYQEIIFKTRYARWNDTKGRRETWGETVDRYINFFIDNFKKKQIIVDSAIFDEIRSAILTLKVMPSMRALATAGKALEQENVAGYNCAYCEISKITVFSEILYILMCGTGVGYSVERQYTNQLPYVPKQLRKFNKKIIIEDSREGWANAYRELIEDLYSGGIIEWDVSKVRQKGAPLKTFGGRASGPGPLVDLFKYTIGVFHKARGRKLKSCECHNICCKIADIVVVGGVRRSALLSLSNLSDGRMRSIKSGAWWKENPHLALANISTAYTEKPEMEHFLNEMLALYMSKSGERGIFNREAARKTVKRIKRRDYKYDFGCNPCCEIILRSNQFCNLSEVIARENDTEESLAYKVRIATIIGTMQATLTDFKHISHIWKHNCMDEALLGVSMTGIMDCNILNKNNSELKKTLGNLKNIAIETNKEWAEKLGIVQAKAITCIKPSGTVSQLVDSSSGIHTRYSPYYIRTIRASKMDPIAQFMVDKGFPCEEDQMKSENLIFSFPIKSPDCAIVRDKMNTINQLKMWMTYQKYWCEHKPSVTINVKEEEWLKTFDWVWDHFDEISGISFLPYDSGIYSQAPYQECTKEKYEEALQSIPDSLNWEEMANFEKDDFTTSGREYACVGNKCEL